MIDLFQVSIEKLVEIKNIEVNTETAILDYKEVFSLSGPTGVEIVKDIVAFANSKGGHIIFGVTKEYKWIGLDERSDEKIDDANLYNLLDKYIDGHVEVVFALHTIGKREFIISYIHPTKSVVPFKIDGKYMKTDRQKKQHEEVVFRKGDVYCRRGSRSIKADHIFFKQKSHNFDTVHNLPSYSPFHRFIGRDSQVEQLHKLLIHENTRLLQVDGIGGIGKTSLVYHYCTLLTKRTIDHNFDFVIWMSGKRTYLTPAGERRIRNYIASYEDVVNEIFNFFDSQIDKDKEITEQILSLLSQYNALLVIDNLETLIEEELNDLLFNLPKSSKAILTTRESISDFQMSKITLHGLKKEDFYEFIEYEYRRLKGLSFNDRFRDNTDELFNLTKGMPLAAQLVVNQLAYDAPINFVLEGLRSGKTYESLLSFCFKGSIERISDIAKRVLYILSIADSEKLFSINDLKYISGFSDDELHIAIQELSKLTLCFTDKTSEGYAGYGTHHLMKLYIREQEIPDRVEILRKYEQFVDELRLIADATVSEEQYLANTRARTHEERISALNIKNIISVFYFNGYDTAIEILDNEINKCPDFAYPHYMKAIIEKMSSLFNSYKLASNEFDRATKLDPELTEAWIDWGYLELEQKNYNRSSEYFKQALFLDSKNPNANHGYARSLFYLCRKSNDISLAELAEIHYERGYHKTDGDTHLSKQQIHSNAINAHSQALNLMINLEDLEKAMEVIKLGLTYEISNNKLSTLKGEINKKLKERKPMELKKRIQNIAPQSEINLPENKVDIPVKRLGKRSELSTHTKRNQQKISEALPTDIIEKLRKMTF
ncbi:RNA-binding domain-containing protein [Bacillus sp. 3255]|uniref:RNA-binding domain-containing protein n=1 Tax=Bacillus sp. 3255 TaxID=2817904 RepID=UPI002861AE7D|nr:RNA-binding domain-containing protein [Bacillus sp. 3255]MDR6880843.1 tetratricopeptide (TPR) repeat protein [Bacillus sp. 3255]